uniref:Exocyst complex component Sec10-like alpha-helical bundle domain-containing protein n=1 Tax=Glossina austeni TaxID=7395 RepID=A0A1A9UCM5_GLOAU
MCLAKASRAATAVPLLLGIRTNSWTDSIYRIDNHFLNSSALINYGGETFLLKCYKKQMPLCKDAVYCVTNPTCLEQMESKLDQGLDRTIDAVIEWVKLLLQNEQKKTGHKPDTIVDTISSVAKFSSMNYLDKPVVRQFMQLRSDFRLIKNTNYIKLPFSYLIFIKIFMKAI